MTFKILTFNAGLFELRRLGITLLKPTDFIQERLIAIPQALIDVNADIIALQEIYCKKHQQYFIDILQKEYPFHCSERNNTLKMNCGLMIFSKKPITNVRYYPLKNHYPIDEKMVVHRGFLACEIVLTQQKKLHIINIHLTSGGFMSRQDSPKIMAIRAKQINEAYDVAKKNTYIATAIVGDFNAGPEIAPTNYEALQHKNFTDCYQFYANKKQLPLEATWDASISLNKRGTHAASTSQRIDHIYMSPQFMNMFEVLNAQVVLKKSIVDTPSEKVHLSDHYGLIGEFFMK